MLNLLRLGREEWERDGLEKVVGDAVIAMLTVIPARRS